MSTKVWRVIRLTFYCLCIPSIYEMGIFLFWLYLMGTESLTALHWMAWTTDLGQLLILFTCVVWGIGIHRIFKPENEENNNTPDDTVLT